MAVLPDSSETLAQLAFGRHVWTAPGGQERSGPWMEVGAVMCTACGCGAVTAGLDGARDRRPNHPDVPEARDEQRVEPVSGRPMVHRRTHWALDLASGLSG